MAKSTDIATKAKAVKKKANQGVVRRRSSRWEFRLELGPCEAQRCLACNARYWLDDRPLQTCPTCSGELHDVRERRQVTRGGFRTQRDAMAALAAARVARDGGEAVTRKDTNQRVGEFLRDWLASVKGTVKPTTYRSYEMHVNKYLIPRLGSIPLRKLATAMINATYQDLRESGRIKNRNKPLSALTIRHIHGVLRLALKDAVAAGLIPHNPAIGAKLPRDRGEAREMQTWTAEQLAFFLASTEGARMHEFWHVGAFTGLRRGELVGLTWDDVTWPEEGAQSGRFRIRRSRVSVGGRAEVSTPKTASGARDVAIDASTVAALRRQAARQLDDHDHWGDAWQDTGYVFTIEDGRPLHPERVRALFALAVREAMKAAAEVDPTRPLPRVRFHDLRHTHATLGLEAGIPVKVISQRLGHKSTRITQDVYQHVLREVQEDAAAQIADLVTLAGKPPAIALNGGNE